MKRKRHREHENRSTSESSQNKRIRPPSLQQQQNLPPPITNNNNNNNGTTEFLKLALERVCALQAELARDTNNDEDNDDENDNEQVDPETAGFAACAIETFRFLASEGITADSQLMQRLSEHLLGTTINNLDLSKI